MVAVIKAFVPGSLLTWIVCLFIGSAGSSGGFLRIYPVALGDHHLYWSWPMFMFGTVLAWALLTLME